MSCYQAHHMANVCGKEGKCSVPMWQGGAPSGFCDHPAFGEQYSNDYRWRPREKPFAIGYCCDHHDGPSAIEVRFFRDGDMWCAIRPGFENLQESHAGFGKTQTLANADLITNEAATS
jgi:hypothetical protein